MALEQARRVRQSNTVDEFQPNTIPLEVDRADRPFDSATNLRTMIRKTAPKFGLLHLGNGSVNHLAQGQDESPCSRGHAAEQSAKVFFLHVTTPPRRTPAAPGRVDLPPADDRSPAEGKPPPQ